MRHSDDLTKSRACWFDRTIHKGMDQHRGGSLPQKPPSNTRRFLQHSPWGPISWDKETTCYNSDRVRFYRDDGLTWRRTSQWPHSDRSCPEQSRVRTLWGQRPPAARLLQRGECLACPRERRRRGSDHNSTPACPRTSLEGRHNGARTWTRDSRGSALGPGCLPASLTRSDEVPRKVAVWDDSHVLPLGGPLQWGFGAIPLFCTPPVLICNRGWKCACRCVPWKCTEKFMERHRCKFLNKWILTTEPIHAIPLKLEFALFHITCILTIVYSKTTCIFSLN